MSELNVVNKFYASVLKALMKEGISEQGACDWLYRANDALWRMRPKDAMWLEVGRTRIVAMLSEMGITL